ncbi:hypothetical protein ACFL4B_01990 [Candidatus Neomarinimicrobiota bacterium]
MTKNTFIKIRLFFTGIVAVGIWSLLLWDNYHDGVPSHHILQQEDLPAISNWWGGILLPILTLFLTHRIQKRFVSKSDDSSNQLAFPIQIINGFIIALSFGIMLSVFFMLGYSNFSGYMVYGLFLLALFFPIYRAECFLGFVIGMTYTIGAVLPTGVGAIFAIIGVLLYRYVRSGIIFIIRKIFSLISPNKNRIKK